MIRRALTLSLVCSIVVGVVLMALVITRLAETRRQVDAYQPGALNYLLQADHNFDRLTATISDYRYFRDAEPERASVLKQQYLREFDLVWSVFNVFEMSADMVGGGQAEINRLIGKFTQFLESAEPSMTPAHELTDAEIDHLLTDGRELSLQLHKVGHAFFLHSSMTKDEWSRDLANLDRVIGLFAALLLITLGVVAALLYRYHRHADRLLADAHDARARLESTVQQLRTGNRERRAKDSFIAAASHDLRQPLHALGLYLGTLERHVADAHGKGMLDEARHCTLVLNRLFNSLLDISRLEAGSVPVTPEHVALQQLFGILERETAVRARDKAIELRIEPSDGYVYADPLLLGRILRNLLDNALKHSGASCIGLQAHLQGNHYRLTVSDNGRGLATGQDAEVFSAEFQLWNPLRDRSKGLGLGLSIVKRLADLMNLPLSVETREGIGTRFHIDVPQGQALEMRSTVPQTVIDGRLLHVRDRVVAVIDDNVDIQLGMCAILENQGIVPLAAESANELIISLRRTGQLPDVLLVDFQLEQDSDGIEAIRKVREALGRDIPAVIVTGVSARETIDAAARGGFRTLLKPVEPEILIDVLAELMAPPTDGADKGRVVRFPRRRR